MSIFNHMLWIISHICNNGYTFESSYLYFFTIKAITSVFSHYRWVDAETIWIQMYVVSSVIDQLLEIYVDVRGSSQYKDVVLTVNRPHVKDKVVSWLSYL